MTTSLKEKDANYYCSFLKMYMYYIFLLPLVRVYIIWLDPYRRSLSDNLKMRFTGRLVMLIPFSS